MIQKIDEDSSHLHGPDNADHELRKAYNCLIDTNLAYSQTHSEKFGFKLENLNELYRHAFRHYRNGNKLAAERWARSVKHLSRAFWHDAKINYLEPRVAELPFLRGPDHGEYRLKAHSDTTVDLINSVSEHIPPGLEQMPKIMQEYLANAREHLKVLEDSEYKNELLRAERINAAHEYGRVLECLALAYESENQNKQAAA